MLYENSLLTDFTKRADSFKTLFAKQRTVINNSSSLLSGLLFKIDKFLPNKTFASDDILKIIENLDSEEVYSNDKISTQILKICDPSKYKYKLLEIIFKLCLECGIFQLKKLKMMK